MPKLKRYQKLFLALAAIASIYVVKATGLDKGLIDDVLEAAIEAVTSEEETPEVPPEDAPEVPVDEPAR